MDQRQLDDALAQATVLFKELPATQALIIALRKVFRDQAPPPGACIVLEVLKTRNFSRPRDAALLLITAVHFEALANPRLALAAQLPTCGGAPGAGLERALDELWAQPSHWARNLSARFRQVHGEPLASLWTTPAIDFFQHRELPYYLIEPGSPGGLNVAADLLSCRADFDSSLIDARLGLDRPILRLEQAEDRLWLRAGVLPDHPDALARLDEAIERFLTLTTSRPGLVQLAECAPALAPQFIMRNIPVENDRGLLLLTQAVDGRLSQTERSSFVVEAGKALQPWGDRGLWIALESGDETGSRVLLHAYRYVGARWTHAKLLEIHFDGTVNEDPEGQRLLRA